MAKISVAILCVLVVLHVSTVPASAAKDNKDNKDAKANKAATAVKSSTSCKKFELILSKLETCTGSGLTFKDFNITLSEDCKLVPTGCVSSAAFKTAKVKWQITTDIRGINKKELTGEADVCKQMDNIPDKAQAIMQAMQVPTSCPMEKGETCADKNVAVDLTKFKDRIWMVTGTTAGKITVEYDVGMACVDFILTLRNKEAKGGRAFKTPKEIAEGKQWVKKNLQKVVLG